MRDRRGLFALAVLLSVLIAGCRLLERSEVLQQKRIQLDGYAYDADLNKVGDARLDLEAEVVRRQKFREEPRLYLRGDGTLRIGHRTYRIVLPDTSPAFLWDNRGYCQNYFRGGRAYLDGEEFLISLHVSEAFDAAYGLIQLEPLPRAVPVPGAGQSIRWGHSGVCFDEEGKTNVEIWRIENPSFVAFTLGPQASPLEKLREYRDQFSP